MLRDLTPADRPVRCLQGRERSCEFVRLNAPHESVRRGLLSWWEDLSTRQLSIVVTTLVASVRQSNRGSSSHSEAMLNGRSDSAVEREGASSWREQKKTK